MDEMETLPWVRCANLSSPVSYSYCSLLSTTLHVINPCFLPASCLLHHASHFTALLTQGPPHRIATPPTFSFLGTHGIPTQLGRITNLQYLKADNTALSGTIPTELSNLTKLASLFMPRSHLSGVLPTQLGALPLLNIVNLAENRISGTLIPELGELTEATTIDLEANPISGTVSAAHTDSQADGQTGRQAHVAECLLC